MDLRDVDRIGAGDGFLAVIATTRANGSVQASVVNAGTVAHPISGQRVVGFVTYGRTKLAHLRLRPRATAVFRSGWEWVAVEGTCQIIGPDDPVTGVDPAGLAELIGAIFRAAGGTHDDWAAFDEAMVAERRAAVLLHPERVYSNGASTAGTA